MAADDHLGYTKMAMTSLKFATVLPIDVMFASRVRFSGSADLMMPLSMTLSARQNLSNGCFVAKAIAIVFSRYLQNKTPDEF